MLVLAADLDDECRRVLGYRDAADALFDERGLTVRCTPWRRTMATDFGGGLGRVFRKLRSRRPGDAHREWAWLQRLPRLGIEVPVPVALAWRRRDSAVVTREVAGRGLDALLPAMGERAAVRYALEVALAPVLVLHAAGLVFRDLYWNHLFTADPAAGTAPIFLDVERTLRPRWRWRRWVVKDLAGLVSSWPWPGDGFATSLCEAYAARTAGTDAAALRAAVLAKAARIRAHRPRYG